MFDQISQEMKEMLSNFSNEDKIIFNGQQIAVNKSNFQLIMGSEPGKSVAFVDGGQAEIFSTGNFCLSFIRVFGQVFLNNIKTKSYQHEFYLFTKAKWAEGELIYESKMYSVTENIGDIKLVDEQDLLVSSNDATLRVGNERAPIGKVTNMARRFAEISLAKQIDADYVVLDGTLEPTFKNEQKYLDKLDHKKVCSLAKSSSLFTVLGNSPVVLLNKIGPKDNCWSYFLNEKTRFVKLNQKAKHVFRFEGNSEALYSLVGNSSDALFLGYPYGLLFADRMARISNNEKSSLKTRFLLKKENKELVDYLNTNNAHDILDNLG